MNEYPPSRYYYLCGVDAHFVWDNNFHLAFEEKKGESVNVNENGIEILIRNARRIPITDEYIDWEYPFSKYKKYYTCRNWQFANWVHNRVLRVRSFRVN